MSKKSFAVALAVSGLMLAQACGSTSSGGAPSGPSSPSPSGPVTAPPGAGGPRAVDVQLVIGAVSAKSGGPPIRATLTLNNTTGKPINTACGLKVAVGLESNEIPFQPAFTLECRTNAPLNPGITTFPVALDTRQQSGPSSPLPALPTGTYRTAIVITGLSASKVRHPGPITVKLT